jgi:hypothetical protein
MIDFNIALANDFLDLYDTKFPAGSILELRSGAKAGADNAAGGVLLVSIVLPAGPFAAAVNGLKDIAGVWSNNAIAAGNIGHFRLRNAASTRIEEGTITVTGGGGDAEIDNVAVIVGTNVNVTLFRHAA